MPSSLQLREHLSSEMRSFAVFFVALVLVYGAWLMVFWPGILGEDSLAILLQVKNPETFNAGKTSFWYYYVQLLYERYHLVELPIGLIMIISAFIMARILGWCWSQCLYRITLFLLVFICLAPHLIYFIGLLYPDGIFSVAVAGLLFETWLLIRQRGANSLSLVVIAIAFPFAVFGRPNAIIFIVPSAALIFMANSNSRRWISIIIICWCSLVSIGSYHYKHKAFSALYPLALFETVNFLQPRPMSNWEGEPRVSPLTVDTLIQNSPLEVWLKHYDPDYWDPLNFGVDSPAALTLPQHDRDVITREFFCYNIWHNFPKFMGSRVNIFLVSALGQGGYPGLVPPGSYTKHILSQVDSQSTYRKFNLIKAENLLKNIHKYNYQYKWLLWTPFLGIGLMMWVLCIGITQRDKASLWVSLPMVGQLAGIFVFSIAGEYRYLLAFFTLPLALLPLIATHNLRTLGSPYTNPSSP